MAGNIEDRGTDKQGRQVWRLRVSTGHRGPDGRYEVVTSTVRGSRRDAERALADLVSEENQGPQVTLVIAALKRQIADLSEALAVYQAQLQEAEDQVQVLTEALAAKVGEAGPQANQPTNLRGEG